MKGHFVQFDSKEQYYKGGSVHKEKKKWGEEHWIVNKDYCGKKLVLKKDHRCSMHSHKEKDEVFYLQSGKVLLELNGERYTLNPGDFIHIKQGDPHRFTGLADSEIFEFSTTHKEDDSYRTELSGHVDQDRYDRQVALAHSMKGAHILVVGDAMLDTYVTGSVDRISPEAPIPVVKQNNRWDVPGGAANVARNVTCLGGSATLIGVRGGDEAGQELEKLLKKEGVVSHLVVDRSRCTTQKQRVMGDGMQQITRIDFEQTHSISTDLQKRILVKIKADLKNADVMLISDYAKGVLTPKFLQKIITIAKKAKVPVVLDPKPFGPEYLEYVHGVTVFTPNRKEALMLCSPETDPKRIAKTLMKELKANVLLTLGGDGMMLMPRKGKVETFAALGREVVDISGAGDTVAATLALVLGAGGSLSDATDISNRAASVVVGKHGTATLNFEELLSAL